METARIIKAYHPSTPLLEEKGLLEMDLGDFDGMEAQQWAPQYPDFRKAWQKAPSSVTMPGGENLNEVQARAIDALDRITQLYPPATTLLVCSHNFVNRTILCYAMDIPLDRFRELRQETAALNVLYKQGERLWAEVVNDGSHLQEFAEDKAG
jgi:broad specificity phosphatase PhoE